MRTVSIIITTMVLCIIAMGGDTVPLSYLPGIPNVRRTFYCLHYNPQTKVSDWVAYEIINYTPVDIARPGSFRIDQLLDSPSTANYTATGYDRGHLCPAEIAGSQIKETFYTSNIAPQSPGMNRGIWKRLENHIRDLATAGHHLIVITGPFYLPDKYIQVIGKDKISIPIGFYKILIDFTAEKTTAWAFPNADQNDSPLKQYEVPVKNIIEK